MNSENKIILESWNFVGFQQGNGGWPEEFIDHNLWFRIIEFEQGQNSNWKPGKENVNRLGWPVHNYNTKEITWQESARLTKNSIFDERYQSYRK